MLQSKHADGSNRIFLIARVAYITVQFAACKTVITSGPKIEVLTRNDKEAVR
jgi:hypothetical protein